MADVADPLALYRTMVRLRQFEERCVELYSAGRIRGFMHVGVGQEATAVGVIDVLDGDDAVVGTYREHLHALTRGVPPEAVLAEMFGFVEGCSGGRGGSMHLFDAGRRFYGGSAIVAGGMPLATGLALADAHRGRPRVTACFFGDGAVAEGEFHEAMNLAALWHLPVLWVCENNQYAMGTALRRSHAATDLALRASSYGVPAWAVDGMDVLAVRAAAAAAVTAIRAGGGPHFLELRTYRFRAHSMYDPERYRSSDEVTAWRARDPIPKLAAHLTATDVCDAAGLDGIAADANAWVDAAVDAASNGTLEPVESLTRHVTVGGWT